MKKSGFTLAEVLITMGIIGIIAALVMPRLVAGSQNAAFVSKLISTVETIETSLTRAIHEEQVDSIFETSMWKSFPDNIDGKSIPSQTVIDSFTGNLKKYMNVSQGYSEALASYYNRHKAKTYTMNLTNGEKGNGCIDMTVAFPVELKNGAVMFVRPYGENESSNKDIASNKSQVKDRITAFGGSIIGKAAEIYIDVNGVTGPNIPGRDRFVFIIDQDGRLHPQGSADFSIYTLRGKAKKADALAEVWTNGVSTNQSACSNGVFGRKGYMAGVGCTARIMQTKKMDY